MNYINCTQNSELLFYNNNIVVYLFIEITFEFTRNDDRKNELLIR